MSTIQSHSCPICGLGTCRSVPGAPASPVRCFLYSEEAKCQADGIVGVNPFVFGRRMTLSIPAWANESREMQSREQLSSLLLLDLPNEIILDIIACLSDIEIYILRSTCRKLHDLLKNRRPPYVLNTQAQDMLEAMLHRDSFRKGCRLEREGGLSGGLGMCSACIRTHCQAAFTPHEWSEPPERRVCRGLTGAVQLCQHKSLALGELRDTLADPESLILQFGAGPLYPPLSCLDASHQVDSRNVPPHISIIRKRPCVTWSFWVLQEE